MKKRTLTKKQKVWKHMLSVLGYIALMYLLVPVYDLLENPAIGIQAFGQLGDPFYIIGCAVAAPLIYLAIHYFTEINPKKFYYCIDIILITVVMILSFFGLVAGLAHSSTLEGILLKTTLLLLIVFVFLFIIYVTWHRGLAIYKDKIRIFKFRIKTYHTTVVDSIVIEYGKYVSAIRITVDGDTTTFRLPTLSAKMCAKRLETIRTAI